MRIGFDFDGVLCVTPFGRLAVHKPGTVPELPDGWERLYEQPRTTNPLRLAVEYARFAWRTSAPDAVAVLRQLAPQHEVYIVTGRSWTGERIVRGWLRKHALADLVKDVRMAPPGLRPAQHKLATAKLLGIDAHIDDDPRTAYYLAAHGVRTYLYDHAGAHGDAPLPAGLVLVRSLREFAEAAATRSGEIKD
jgi:FMN phosphatase YigB (HAD superfamily)